MNTAGALPAGAVYTQQFLSQKYGDANLEKSTPIAALVKYCKERYKPDAVLTFIGNNTEHGNKSGFLAQATVGNYKTVAQGADKKKAKQVAASAMLMALQNKNHGAQLLKYGETEAGHSAQLKKATAGVPTGWSVASGKKTLPAAKATVTTKVKVTASKAGNVVTVTKDHSKPPEEKCDFTEEKAAADPDKVINAIMTTPVVSGPLEPVAANAKVAEILQSGKNSIAYCEEASRVLSVKLTWTFSERRVVGNKTFFTCTATFGTATVTDECLQKKAAKTNAATKLITGILTAYGDPAAKKTVKRGAFSARGRGAKRRKN